MIRTKTLKGLYAIRWVLVLMVTCFFLDTGHTAAGWSDTLDLMIAVADRQENGKAWDPETLAAPFHIRPASTTVSSSLPDIMLCVVDATGEMQCHHQEGVIEGHANISGGTVCRGGEAQLKAYCEDSTVCFLHQVPVPKDIFGLLLLEMDPPLRGRAQHQVIDGVIVLHTVTDQAMVAYAQITAALHSLAQCLAPTSSLRQNTQAFPVFMRTTCEDHLCTLRQSALWLAPQIKNTVELR
jgi:hypothetical protein